MAAADYRHPSAGSYTNAAQVGRDLAQYGGRVQLAAGKATARFGLLLETRIKARASGRPGPRALTGNYRRSWHTTVRNTTTTTEATVGTNAPQARRLEYGYVGADRLGRVYDQPPYPHVGPALTATEPEFVAALERIANP